VCSLLIAPAAWIIRGQTERIALLERAQRELANGCSRPVAQRRQ
jgi:hypothetical protein